MAAEEWDQLGPVAEMTTPQLVREYGRHKYTAGLAHYQGMSRSLSARRRLHAVVTELRTRGIID